MYDKQMNDQAERDPQFCGEMDLPQMGIIQRRLTVVHNVSSVAASRITCENLVSRSHLLTMQPRRYATMY